MPPGGGASPGLVANFGVGGTMAVPTPILRFVGRRKSEAERQQLVLLAHRPGACEIEPFAQPQHGLEPPDRASCRVKGLKAADPRHRLLDPEDPMGVWLATCAP